MYEHGQVWIETQKYERQCRGCRKWFWAWGPDRTHCYFCHPLPRAELTSFNAAMESGNGHGNSTGLKAVSALVLMRGFRPADAMGAVREGAHGAGTTSAMRPADLCGSLASR
jgi:hypothetical protein